MNIGIKAIEYHLPNNKVSNIELGQLHPDWDMEKIFNKTGVEYRHWSSESETAFDLSVIAVEKLLRQNKIDIDEIDGIVYCTQSQDYIMPSNSYLLHKKFNLKNKVWTFDINLACSGYIYGISIVRGMLESGMGKNILLITADTYSKFINKNDRSTSVLFGDGAAATLIGEESESEIIDIILETSGENFDTFYIPAGGCRLPASLETKLVNIDESGNFKTLENIHMNGFAVWKFISRTVPDQINFLLNKNNLKIDDIDFFGFHQASKLTLDSLIKVLKIKKPVYSNLVKSGNLVSSSIPVLLKNAIDDKQLKRGDLVLLSGFGVGLSWGSILLKY